MTTRVPERRGEVALYEDVRPKTPLVVWGLTGAIVAAYLAFLAASPDTQRFVDYTFALIPQRLNPESPYHFAHWWEALGPLFGHSFLHLGWWHVGANALFLFGASRWVSLRLGAVRYLVVYFASVLSGALLFLALNWNGEATAVGASGGVCGMLTAFFFSTRRTWREALADRQVRGPLGGLVFVNVVLMGIASAAGWFPIAWEGHLGGFIGGGVAYALLAPHPRANLA